MTQIEEALSKIESLKNDRGMVLGFKPTHMILVDSKKEQLKMNLKNLIAALSEVMAEKANVDTQLKFVQKEKTDLLKEWPTIVSEFHEQLGEIEADETKLIEAQTVIADKFGAIMLEANTSLPYRILRKVYGIVGGPLF